MIRRDKLPLYVVDPKLYEKFSVFDNFEKPEKYKRKPVVSILNRLDTAMANVKGIKEKITDLARDYKIERPQEKKQTVKKGNLKVSLNSLKNRKIIGKRINLTKLGEFSIAKQRDNHLYKKLKALSQTPDKKTIETQIIENTQASLHNKTVEDKIATNAVNRDFSTEIDKPFTPSTSISILNLKKKNKKNLFIDSIYSPHLCKSLDQSLDNNIKTNLNRYHFNSNPQKSIPKQSKNSLIFSQMLNTNTSSSSTSNKGFLFKNTRNKETAVTTLNKESTMKSILSSTLSKLHLSPNTSFKIHHTDHLSSNNLNPAKKRVSTYNNTQNLTTAANLETTMPTDFQDFPNRKLIFDKFAYKSGSFAFPEKINITKLNSKSSSKCGSINRTRNNSIFQYDANKMSNNVNMSPIKKSLKTKIQISKKEITQKIGNLPTNFFKKIKLNKV